MRLSAASILILLAAVTEGCVHSKETAFYRNFTLQSLAGENQTSFLDCGAGGGGGSSIFTMSGPSSREFHSQKRVMGDCTLKTDGSSNEALMAVLTASLEREIKQSGADVTSSRQKSPTSIYLEYALKDVKGSVELVVKQIPGNRYDLQASLEESGKQKSWW